MSNPIDAILDTANEIPFAARALLFAPACDRAEKESTARGWLDNLRRLVERLLDLGLPPIRDNYPDGRQAWEWDVRRDLPALCNLARELIETAARGPVPPLPFQSPPGDSLQLQAFAEARSQVAVQLQRSESLFRESWNGVWRLAQAVDVVGVRALTGGSEHQEGEGRRLTPNNSSTPPSGDRADDEIEDGPRPPNLLCWRGRDYPIGSGRAKQAWKLLSFLWSLRDGATVSFDHLFGPKCVWEDVREDSTVRSTVNRLNNCLPKDFPWTVETRDRHVVKQPRTR